MGYGRFVLTAKVTIAAGTASAPGQYNTLTYSNGSGSASKWAPPAPHTLLPGMIIFADDTAPGTTPTGSQQLYQAIGAANLRAFIPGTDAVGHAALAN